VLSGNMNHFGDVLYNPYGSTEVSWVCIADSTHLRADPPPPARHPSAPS
jgi:fatty-acyl-CoA synthase